MKSGKARLVLLMLLTTVLVSSLAALSCGGGSKKSQTPTPPPSAATNTPMVMPTGTPAALTPTQTPSTPQAQQASVQIKDFEFAPSKVTIKVGGTVTWTNEGASAHTVTADDGSFDSGTVDENKTYSQTFSTAGTIAYHCTIHTYMTGTITVLAGGLTPPPTDTEPLPHNAAPSMSSLALILGGLVLVVVALGIAQKVRRAE